MDESTASKPAPGPNMSAGIPDEAINWVRGVFAAANSQVSGTLSRIPTHHEPELDMLLISALNQAPAVADVSGWTVYIQTHFLGGRRHFYNWEVADIGLLIIFRDRGKILRIKVGLLQSKRLYATETKQLPDHKKKFKIGFATLLHEPEVFRQLAAGRTFTFDESSQYLAISNGDEQQHVLSTYQKMSTIPVYYLLYNPVDVPWSATVPATALPLLPPLKVGCRVVPADTLISAMSASPQGYNPRFKDVVALGAPFVEAHVGGWRLEHFVADLMLRCSEGHIASGETDHVLEQLFYNRSGPISAAIAITVEAPAGTDFVLPDIAPAAPGR